MPLYDCMLLLKPHIKKEQLIELVTKVGRRATEKNGVLTDIKSFGTVQLGYGIKKLDGKYFQPLIKKEQLMELVTRVGRRATENKGVLTDIKLFGTVQLGYGIKKLDGKYFQGQMMQMTMMATPNFNKDLQLYLNKEDRLLRWLLVKHRNTRYGLDFMSEDDWKGEMSTLPGGDNFDDDEDDDDDDDVDDDNEGNDDFRMAEKNFNRGQ